MGQTHRVNSSAAARGAGNRDAIVVGAGPNGLAAAVRLSGSGRSVLVLEGAAEIGGGCRTTELTLPGFLHDICSAVHPTGIGSPYFAALPLGDHGLEWIHPDIPLAHPFDDGSAAVLERSLTETVAALGRDGATWRRLVGRSVARWDDLTSDALGPLVRIPRHPFLLAAFGLPGVLPASVLVRAFRTERIRALFAGLAAHAILPLTHPFTGVIGLTLGAAAHAVGWPVARGGSRAITDALAGIVTERGGSIETGHTVKSMSDLPSASAYLFDVDPRQLASIAGDRFPDRYRNRMAQFPIGPGVFKVDYALDGPVPWTAEACRRAGTVHVGGTFAEIAEAEALVARGEHAELPFVLVAQQSLFDPTRAPEGQHTLWAYCHVPNGSTLDMTDRIDAQIERFAPGFRDRILARASHDTAWYAEHNRNYAGGDIAGGSYRGLGVLSRPTLHPVPYATPDPSIYLCSSSTPPGAGVHGMCGYHAAETVLGRVPA